MKKTYIHPQTWAVRLEMTEMLALSLGVDNGSGGSLGGEDDWLTREGGWSSDDWGELEDEED